MSRFGPFETQAVEDLSGVIEFWQNAWGEENALRLGLENRLEQSDQTMAELNMRHQEVLMELERLKGKMRRKGYRCLTWRISIRY